MNFFITFEPSWGPDPFSLKNRTLFRCKYTVQENQKVIDTGLYGVVRHPMYMATTVLFLAMPLVQASPVSFLIMLLYIPLIAKRIKMRKRSWKKGWRVTRSTSRR